MTTGTPTIDLRSSVPLQQARQQSRVRGRRIILIPGLLFLGFFAIGFYTSYIPSESMLPTLQVGDHALTMRSWLAYPGGRLPGRGDIILFRLPAASSDSSSEASERAEQEGARPDKQEDILIKRVIGLPGDTIWYRGRNLYVNGKLFPEKYAILPVEDPETNSFPHATEEPYTVPANSVFVLGDNREHSEDSRVYGAIKREWIVGRYMKVLYHREAGGSGSMAIINP